LAPAKPMFSESTVVITFPWIVIRTWLSSIIWIVGFNRYFPLLPATTMDREAFDLYARARALGDTEEATEEAAALLERGLADQALIRLRQSIELLPNNPFAHHQTGLALDLLNQPVEAEKELKLALSLAQSLKIDLPMLREIAAEQIPQGKA